MVLQEHTFTSIVTYEFIAWRKCYIAGTIVAKVDVSECDEECKQGSGRLVEIVSVDRPKLYDDYTDLHGGIDTITNPVTLDEIKKMVEGKEGTFSHIETMIPPQHQFKLNEQFPLDLKPPPGMPVF